MDDEYSMLRTELLQSSKIENETINFFYAFVSAILGFSLTKTDTIFIFLVYAAIIPAYLLVISKEQTIYKIGTYLNVFHEGHGKNINWERRNARFYNALSYKIMQHFESFNMPFLFTLLFTLLIFLYKTKWSSIWTPYELTKVIFFVLLGVIILIIIIKNRKVDIEQYIKIWERIKIEEAHTTQ